MAANAVALPRASSDSARQQPSRFLEGSMNDRVSAKPPPDFLGPDLEAYERQFYVTGTNPASPGISSRDPQYHVPLPAGKQHGGRRRERPLSAEAQLGSALEHFGSPRSPLAKKPTFFGRLKGALGFGSPTQPKEEVKRKHGSLQDQYMPPPPVPATSFPITIQQSPSRPSPRQWKSQSNINIQPIPGMMGMDGVNNLSDRPSREEILESYQQLMASGFFKAHAIQSTRQPGPRGVLNQQNTSASQTPTITPVSMSPPPSPTRQAPPVPMFSYTSSKQTVENDVPSSMFAALSAVQNSRASVSYDEPQEDSMDWQNDQESRYTLRGRKRGRVAETDETACTESSLAQPLRKMAKKLRKIPSSLTSPSNTTCAAMQIDAVESVAAYRVPSVSMGVLPVPHSDRQLRSRVASPAPIHIPAAITQDHEPRRSMSGAGSIGGSGINRLRKRGKSPATGKARPPPVCRGGLEAASIRSSMESTRTVESQYGGVSSLKISRLRERNSRPSTPDPLATRTPQSFQNIQNLVPQVPRIPSIYKQHNVDISSTENTRPRGERRFV